MSQPEDGIKTATTTTTAARSKSSGNNSDIMVDVTLSSTQRVTNEDDGSSSSCCLEAYRPEAWQYALYHITVSVLGGSVVCSIPIGFAYLQWWGAIILFVASTVFTFYSGWCLIELQTFEDRTYSDIADRCMKSPGWANKFVRPFQALVFFVVTVLNILVLGMGYVALDDIVNNTQTLSLSVWIVIGGITFLVFALIPNLDQQWALSLLGTVCGIFIAIMVTTGSGIAMSNGSRDDIESSNNSNSNGDDMYGRVFDDNLDFIMGVFDAFGIIALAYGGHSVLPDVQASLKAPSTPSSKGPKGMQHSDYRVDTRNDVSSPNGLETWRRKQMKTGLFGAYSIIAPCYLVVGIVGYLAFGKGVSGFVVDDISDYVMSDVFVGLAWIFLMVNAIALGAIYVQAAFILIEDILPSLVANKQDFDNDCEESSPPSPDESLEHPTAKSDDNESAGDAREEVIQDDASVSSRSFSLPYTSRQLLMRISLVSLCTFVACAFPSFANLGGLIGSVGFIPLTFVYPILFWNCSDRGNQSPRWVRIMNWILIVVWTIVGVCGMVGSTYFIVQSTGSYGFFPYSN
mmetsp:Transcript_45806/g.111687  ORF Transcript_45806/g.111687 Transcript_45806/m.111687 type:complete len:572 (+) Transcript_45806:377-2092(+)|eukprot:CAMPEP_0113455900 /NCGR_PEP_ID=MMETSP0014_2-20120614/8610_1 /TAXON_ID=2857 /ORGANISM="Nitzschia sp." /LENGTH=571 /DNA_ID=CAMNT_0000347337 /DNA_START=325 /DNA_END=2040 /DNA_ORIENTATION=- /assembly_acc=CAM_ASM_000159